MALPQGVRTKMSIIESELNYQSIDAFSSKHNDMGGSGGLTRQDIHLIPFIRLIYYYC